MQLEKRKQKTYMLTSLSILTRLEMFCPGVVDCRCELANIGSECGNEDGSR